MVYKELRRLKRKKASGIDELPPGILKDSAAVIAKPLAHIINLSLASGIFPTDWKIGKVFPLLKSRVKSNIDNYRPITVLPIL